MLEAADAPPPTSRHSWSWRELSQRFSWFCLKLLSPPGANTQKVTMTIPRTSELAEDATVPGDISVHCCRCTFLKIRSEPECKAIWRSRTSFRGSHRMRHLGKPSGMLPGESSFAAPGNFISSRLICFEEPYAQRPT